MTQLRKMKDCVVFIKFYGELGRLKMQVDGRQEKLGDDAYGLWSSHDGEAIWIKPG